MKYNKIEYNYDVIIVGGGPAGTTAAYLLDKKGYEVLIIDKKKFPRNKLCGGLLTKKTLNILSDIYNFNVKDLKKDKVINYISDSYKIYFKDKLITNNNMKDKFHLVKRNVYDNYLLRSIKKKNIKIKENTKVNDIDFKKNTIITDKKEKLRANYIIAADGANSKIRNKLLTKRKLKKSSFIKNNQSITLEIEVPREKFNFDLKEPILYFGVINWGYGWVFPKQDNITVGLGGLKRKNSNFKKLFQSYLKLINLEITESNIKGWPLPFGNYLEKTVYKNTFLIGDAANFVDPLTGEGIYYAHKSALIVSEVIDELFQKGTDNTNLYKRRINHEINSNLKRAKLYRTILWSSPKFIQNLLVRLGSKYFHDKITRTIQGYNLF